jgi:hypothetical protein
MTMLRWRFSFGPRPASILFGGVGLLLFALGMRNALERRERLAHWPRIDARVDSVAVANMVSGGGPRDLYAARLWVTYDWRGWPVRRAVTEEVYSNSFSAAVRAGRQALASRHVELLVDPSGAEDLSFQAGYNWEFFFDALILSTLGVFFCAFAALFFAIARGDARKAERKARGEPAPPRKSLPRWAVVSILFSLGLMFVVGGLWGTILVHQERGWPTVEAHVDSSDVVWDSQGHGSGRAVMYAARYWVTYAIDDVVYRAPVIAGAWFSSRGYVERRARAGRDRGNVQLDVDPHDPYRLIGRASTLIGAYWLPSLFVAVGVLVWGIPLLVVLLMRRRRAARQARRQPRAHAMQVRASHQE